MGRLPVYTNNANIRVAEANKISPLYDGRAIDSLAGKIKDLSVQWQETQNAAESLDGKNKMLAQTSDILTEAENFHDYKNPAEIKAKEDELLGKMDSVLKTVSGGFTNERNAANFNQKYFLTMEENKEALKAKFRKKFIDNANANLAISYENNMQNYISSGSEAYKKSYLADVENMYNAGYIDQEEKVSRIAKTKDWNFSRASSNLSADPEGTLANVKNYGLKPDEETQIIKAATSLIEHKKYYDGMAEIVKKGTEGNRLFNKYMEEGLSVSEIQNNQVISDAEKTALMHLSGYDSATFKNAKATQDAIVAQLELDEKIKNTIRGTDERPRLMKDKDVSDLNELRQDVYKLLESGQLGKEKAMRYMNSIIGATLREADKISKSSDTSGQLNNPYAEGLIALDGKLSAEGVDNKKIMAGAHNLYFEAMDDQMQKLNPEGKSWSELPEKTRNEIQNKATAYAMSNVPNLSQAKEEFSYFLPPSKRKAALDSFMERYNPDMTDPQKKELIQNIKSEQKQKAIAETDMALSNAQFDFKNEEAFMSEANITKEDVIFTAQRYGVSVEEVIQKIKETRHAN